MVKFNSTPRTQKSRIVYDTYNGVDFAKTPATTAITNSPNAINMIRDEIGKVRRRMGYETLFDYTSGTVYGIHKLDDDFIIHVGTKLYKEKYNTVNETYTRTTIYTDMNTHRSVSQRFEGKLYLLDGKTYLCYDGTTCAPVEAYIPTVMIACDADGYGTPLEDYNLLSAKHIVQYQYSDVVVESEYKEYIFARRGSGIPTTEANMKVERYNFDTAEWETYTRAPAPYDPTGKQYRVMSYGGGDYYAVRLHYNYDEAPPIVGQDTLRLTLTRTGQSEKIAMINKCDTMTMYGINGQEKSIVRNRQPRI